MLTPGFCNLMHRHMYPHTCVHTHKHPPSSSHTVRKLTKEERVYLGSQFEDTVHHGREAWYQEHVRELVTLYLQSGSRERYEGANTLTGIHRGVCLSQGVQKPRHVEK